MIEFYLAFAVTWLSGLFIGMAIGQGYMWVQWKKSLEKECRRIK